MPELFDQTLVTTVDSSSRLVVGGPDAASENITVGNFVKQYVADSDGWVQPTLNSGYNHTSGNELKYRIDKLGHIEVKGSFIALSSPVPANDVVFTLPVGARPSDEIFFDFVIYGGRDPKVGYIGTNGQFKKSDSSAWSNSYPSIVNFIKTL